MNIGVLIVITLMCITWSLWIRRVTWGCRWEVAATLNIALQGVAVFLMSPFAGPHGQSSTAGFDQDRLLTNSAAWSAGHSVSGVSAVTSVPDLVATLTAQYAQARAESERKVTDE